AAGGGAGVGWVGAVGGLCWGGAVEAGLCDWWVGDLSRPRWGAGVGRARTRECAGGVRDLPRAPGSGCCAVASTLQGDFSGRSGRCRYGPDGPSRPPWLALAETDQAQLWALSTRVSPL